MLSLISFLLLSHTALALPLERGVQPDPCKDPISENDEKALDFGGNCRYEKANAALPPATDHRVVYLGDSITQGWLKRIVGISHDDVLNRGVGGQTSAQLLIRFRADVLNLKPKIVHIMVGTNDVAGNTGVTSIARIQGAIMSMAEQAKAHNIRVILASIPPAKTIPWNPSVNPVPSIKAINRWMRDYAASEGHVYADYFSALTDGNDGFRRDLAFDGIHPTAAGYAVMETIAADAIRRALR